MSAVEAATVVLLRRIPGGAGRRSIDLATLPATSGSGFSMRQLGGHDGKIWFAAGWQVLLGQSEVQNWVRSGPDQPAVMRYGGEWKFPGGRREPDESLTEAAWRELSEEFCVTPRNGGVLHRLNRLRTKPVRGVSFDMHNFVALAIENDWLAELHPDSINAALAARRERFLTLLKAGDFWPLGKAERERVAPEVRRVAWLGLQEAAACMLSSKAEELVPVDSWQAAEYARLGVTRRDPMFQTLATLLEIGRFESEPELRAHCCARSNLYL